jgi:hypothetical protein
MTFQARLRKCMQDGNLTIADLARWFDRTHPTVGSWVRDGSVPGGGPLDIAAVITALARLEKMIATSSKFPVPRLSPQARIAYIEKLMK